MRLGFYNQGALAIVFDGKTITDLGSDFGYRINMPDAVGSLTLGTERAVNNATTNKTCTVDISVMPTSESNDLFLEFYYNQVRGQGREVSMTIISTEGEKWGFNKCMIGKVGNAEGGGSALVPREYTFNVVEVVPDTGNFPN